MNVVVTSRLGFATERDGKIFLLAGERCNHQLRRDKYGQWDVNLWLDSRENEKERAQIPQQRQKKQGPENGIEGAILLLNGVVHLCVCVRSCADTQQENKEVEDGDKSHNSDVAPGSSTGAYPLQGICSVGWVVGERFSLCLCVDQ